ncbi:MAG: hypothetical protein AAFR31_09295, partial [Cyanobacteria bacterium J06627_8]
VNTKQIAKLIRASAKRVIASTDINTSTRKGNKELDFIAKRMADAQPLTPADAEQLGQALGERIVALSQSLGRKNLDQGVLHQLAVKGDLPSLDGAEAAGKAASASKKGPSSDAAPTVESTEASEPDTEVIQAEETPAETEDENAELTPSVEAEAEINEAEPEVEAEAEVDETEPEAESEIEAEVDEAEPEVEAEAEPEAEAKDDEVEPEADLEADTAKEKKTKASAAVE